MSADLLAEFGQGSGPPHPSASRPQTGQTQTNSLILDLEGPNADFLTSISENTKGGFQASKSRFPANQYSSPTSRLTPGFQTFDLPQQNDSDVLFDATIDTPASDIEDDWGEFEGPESTSNGSQPQHSSYNIEGAKLPATKSQAGQIPHTSGTIDLLDSSSMEDPVPVTRNLQSGSINKSLVSTSKPPLEPKWDDDFGDWGEFTDEHPIKVAAAKAAPKSNKPAVKPISKQPNWDDDVFEDWGDFTDGQTTTTPAPPRAKPKSAPTTSPDPRSFTAGAPTPPSATVRPTNIPPPSVLLSLLVDILTTLQKEATKSQARTTPESIKAHTATKIHTTLTTAARIIAGRSLRWKRDTILSQSMRIGPAGKPGGMKLSTVNKHEDVKESQDAVDVLTLWRERASLFNGVIQAAGQRPIPAAPDPSALKVITARPEQGALKAAHACALCALKRDERVLRVDEGDVQDSFGEWWTDHWGHTTCRVFWEANRHLLGQR